MTALYAQTRHILQPFFALAFVVALAGCAGGGAGMSLYNPPMGLPDGGGVVTQNPAQLPDIAWQTPNQRESLTRRSEAFARAQTQAEQQSQGIAPPEGARDVPAYEGGGKDASAGGALLKPRGKATVALLVPLSGQHAELGQGMLKAAQMALFDVGSVNLELVPRDTRGTPEGAAAAARAAIAQGADMILGPVFSEELQEVRRVASGNGTPVISYSTDWTQAGGDTYVMGFLPFAQVARVVSYAQDHGYRKFAVYAPQTEYCDLVINTLRRTSADIVRVARYSPQQSDLSLLVNDFVETSRKEGAVNAAGVNFDALVLPVGGQNLRTLTAMFDAAGVRSGAVRFIGTGLWDDASISGDAALSGGWYAAPDPRPRADFEKRYKDNYGAAPPRIATLAYDSTALAAVLAHAGGAGKPYARDRLTHARGFAGIDGIFRFRSDGLPERGLAVLEIQSGRPKVIDPAPTAFVSSGS